MLRISVVYHNVDYESTPFQLRIEICLSPRRLANAVQQDHSGGIEYQDGGQGGPPLAFGQVIVKPGQGGPSEEA